MKLNMGGHSLICDIEVKSERERERERERALSELCDNRFCDLIGNLVNLLKHLVV